MKRLDYCKIEIDKKRKENFPIALIYQEMNNMLPTLKEKQALQEYLSSSDTKKKA